MDFIMSSVAAFVTAHPWMIPVIIVLLAVSEALPYFPNVESNNVVQLVVNGLKALRDKLSLSPPTEPPAPPAQQ